MSEKHHTDTSSISFTALYTGHVWQAYQLSDDIFYNHTGNLFFHLLAPFEYLGKKITGGNIRTFLLQRHILIDHLVTQAIEQEGVTQILEIACGLSPRGLRFRKKYDIHYVEADLPEMAANKHRLLARHGLLGSKHQVVPLNILHEQSNDSLESIIQQHFDTRQPLLVITEGLINYFSLPTISQFWQRLATTLQQFPQGIYLTDNYPLMEDHPFRKTMRGLGGLLGTISRSNVNFHFERDDETQSHFSALGFTNTRIHNPADYYDTLSMPQSRGQSLVRIIEART